MSPKKTLSRPSTSNSQEGGRRYRGGLLLVLAMYSNPKWLCVVRGAVERLVETLGFPPGQCRSVIRAVDEALSNVMRHSYGNRLHRPIAMYFRKARRHYEGEVQEGLEILLCDRGPAVDATKLHGRALDQIRPGGLGLHLVRLAMDTVEFTRKGRMNRLRLVKYLAQSSNAL